MNVPGVPDPIYVLARRALLDVLEALDEHRKAVTLVGAQAVYLRVGEALEALSSYTTDADLALNPALLSSEPALESVLEGAGFRRREQPGLWFNPQGIEVDLLVPASIGGRRGRAADLGEHHERLAAMQAAGLEAALVDSSLEEVSSLELGDQRTYTIHVAGAAALLIAKLHKIGERADNAPNRLKNKDASDLFLLLQRTTTENLAKTIQELKAHSQVRSSVGIGLRYLRELFSTPEGAGLELLRDAVRGIEDEETTAQSCMALANDLLALVGDESSTENRGTQQS